VPLVVLVAARPELRELRPSLATAGGVVADVVTLAGLDAGAATRLAANVIGATELPAAVAGRVLATSEGNPLFVGELVRMLVQDGALKREGDRWTAGVELAALEMPPTIHALLAARIERLRPGERAVLERAAVVGRQFSRAAVAALLPESAHADLDAQLEALRQSELVEPDAGAFLGDPALRFHHLLVRDAAYRRLLKETRAELHARFGEWIVARVGDAVDSEETVGWHFEQAHQHLRELGPLDAAGDALGERAARYLAAAGRRALARDDLPLAATLLGRALERLEDASATRPDLTLDWCEALLATGDVTRGAQAVDALGRLAGDSVRLRAWHTCFAGQLAALTDPQTLRTTADRVAAAAAELAAAGDTAGEAKAYSVHATALARLGQIGASEAALDRALAAARRAGDRRRANAVLSGAPAAALWGPSPVTRASGRCLDVVRVLRITQGAPAVEATALRCQAVLEALRGRTDAARRMIESARRLVEELGLVHQLLEADVFAAHIELIAGDAVAAEQVLRPAYEGLRRQQLGIDAAQAAALLGRALLAQDRAADAEALSLESEALAGDDLKAAIAWRGVRAEALARRGAHADAVALAHAAVDIAAATDALLDHADARQALATALRAAGRSEEAASEAAHARRLWDAKGATNLAERARGEHAHAADAGRATTAPDREAGAGRAAEAHAPRFANAAVRAQEAFERAWRDRDWNAVVRSIGPGLRMQDGRAVIGVDIDHDGFLAHLRMLFDTRSGEFRSIPIATRGERFVLLRARFLGETAAGGPFEVAHLSLVERDAEGRQVTLVLFDAAALDAAYAALDERWLAGEGAPYAELFANERAFRLASASRDWDAVTALLPEDYTMVNHRRFGGTGTRMTREEYVSWRRSADDLGVYADMRTDHVPRISARAGLHVATSFGTMDGGAFELPFVSVYTHDGRRFHSSELFDLERYDEALARYETLAGESGAHFANAATRSYDEFGRCWRARDWAGVVACFAPDARLVDRRAITGVDLEGDAFFASFRVAFEDPSACWRAELLATRGDRLALYREAIEGENLSADIVVDGGPAAVEYLAIDEVGVDGRIVLNATFDPDALAAAYGFLDDRYAAGEGAAHAELLGTIRRFCEVSTARDWLALAALLPADFQLVSRRRLVGTESPIRRAEYLATRGAMDDLGLQGALRVDHVLRVSGSSAVVVVTWYGTLEGGGAFEDTFVNVLTHDGHRVHAMELFDLDDLDAVLARSPTAPAAAVATGGRRWSDGFVRCWETRDWDGLAVLFAPDFVLNDHRVFGWEPLRGPAMSVRGLRGLVELAPDVRLAVQHLTAGARGFLSVLAWQGTCDGGAFGAPIVMVGELDGAGRLRRLDQYDPAGLEAARRRYAELSGPEGATPLRVTAATRAAARLHDAWESRGRADFATLFAPGFRLSNRRRFIKMEWDRDQAIEAARVSFEMGSSHHEYQVLATRGDRLLLGRVRWQGSDDLVGPTQVDWFEVLETDERGSIVALVVLDGEDVDAAYAELDDRYAAGDAAPHAHTTLAAAFRRAFAERDWEALAALLSPDVVVADHRLLGWEPLRGPAAYVGALRSLVELAPDVRLRIDHVVATSARRVLYAPAWVGTRDGGAFEEPSLIVAEIDEQGRFRRFDQFDPSQLDEARNRYASDPEPRPSDPLAALVSPNAASAAMDRVQVAFEARDWASLRSLCADRAVVEDRRRHSQLGGDVEWWLADLQVIAREAPDARYRRQLVGTAGDRVALERVLWTGGPPEARFEIEYLWLSEVDERGAIVTMAAIDLEDAPAVAREVQRRWFAHDPVAAAVMAPVLELADAMASRDVPRLRAVLADDVVVDDHRPTRLGTIEGGDAYAASLGTLWELAPDIHLDPVLGPLVWDRHGCIGTTHTSGTFPAGGSFETYLLSIVIVRDGRIARLEYFDPDGIAEARERFAALRSEVPRTPPDAATRQA
jgi:ketosteroid isomerase-like protein